MTTPWRYRPENPEELDWEDNPVSNTMAWLSDALVPSWCETEFHWTTRVLDMFWTTCACCLFYRGIALGAALGVIGTVALSIVF